LNLNDSERRDAMRHRTNLGALALLVLAGLLIWFYMRNHKTTITTELSPAANTSDGLAAPAVTFQVKTQGVGASAPSDHAAVAARATPSAPIAASPPSTIAEPPAAVVRPQIDQNPAMGDGSMVRYTAQPGDSLSKMAAELLGADTKSNRDAILNKNPSLRDNPDRIVAGQVYLIPLQHN
jgi:nucleoid-associated protein YgaU